MSSVQNAVSRVSWIDVGRGLAMLMVVTSHTIERSEGGVQPDAILQWTHALTGSAQLPLFFFLSGMLSVSALSRPWPLFFKSRLLPLIWVFLLWQPVVFAYKFAAGAVLPGQEDASIPAQIARALVSPLRPSGELWFLWALAIYLVVAKLTRELPRWLVLGAAGLISLAAVTTFAILSSDYLTLLGPGLRGLPTYFFFFLLGVASSQRIQVLARSKKAILIAASAVVVWIGFIAFTRAPEAYGFASFDFINGVVGCIGGLGAAWLLARVTPLALVGRASLNVYLIHTPLLVAILIITHELGILAFPWAPLAVGVVVALVTAGGVGFYLLTERGHATWLVAPPTWLSRRFAAPTRA
jgi:surface polysaccharide O-acyltransferase-like enzyme